VIPEQHATTSTLKLVKRTLAAEPFARLGRDGYWILRDGRYAPLTEDLLAKVRLGILRLRPGRGAVTEAR
jgi:hypothetical protein